MKKLIISSIIAVFTAIILHAELEEKIEYDRSPSRIKVSVENINRLVFPDAITFKVWSKEKNVDITTHENELYIKYQPLEQVVSTGKEAEERVIVYEGVPVDLFVKTKNDKTYSLILLPLNIESRNVELVDNTISSEHIASNLMKADSHSSIISTTIQDVFSDKASYLYDISFSEFAKVSDCYSIKQTKKLENSEYTVNLYDITGLKNCNINEKKILKVIDEDAIGFAFKNKIESLDQNQTVKAALIKKVENVIW
jgi:hypothetical protein